TRFRLEVLHATPGTLEEHRHVEGALAPAEVQAGGVHRVAVLRASDAVLPGDLPVPVDVDEADVARPGIVPVRIRHEFGGIAEDAIRLIEPARAHLVAGRPLVIRNVLTDRFVPEVDLVLAVAGVQRDVEGDIRSHFVGPRERSVIAPARNLTDVLGRETQTGGEGNRRISRSEEHTSELQSREKL